MHFLELRFMAVMGRQQMIAISNIFNVGLHEECFFGKLIGYNITGMHFALCLILNSKSNQINCLV